MPAAKKPRENIPKGKRQAVEGPDAKLNIMMYVPDHEPVELNVTIPNLQGGSTWNRRTPKFIGDLILNTLRGNYGNKVG
jgi:hypothetical protein